MTHSAARLLAAALSQAGYKERAGNRNKFGAWFGMDNAPWCAIFIAWCAAQAGIPPHILRSAYCPQLSAWFRARGQLRPAAYLPRPGDLVFFDRNHNNVPDHVGVVVRAGNGFVHTVEGNQGDMVQCCSYALRDPALLCYGAPAYREEDTMPEIRIKLLGSGQIVTVCGFNIEGTNYLRLRDVALLAPLDVDWDEAARLPTVAPRAARA